MRRSMSVGAAACICAALIVGVMVCGTRTQWAAADAGVLTAFYGTCGWCDLPSICSGNSTNCPSNQTCSPSGSQCATITRYYPTTSCIDNGTTQQGHCDNGAPYVCWEQFSCLCEDSWWTDYCKDLGPKIGGNSVSKKNCIP